jgi:hypothetical protein
MTTDTMTEEDVVRRRSSWSAALAQLPGYPAPEQAAAPQPAPVPARQVSGWSAEDEEEESLEQ